MKIMEVNMKNKNKILATLFIVCSLNGYSTTNKKDDKVVENVQYVANNTIKSVKSYGFVDLEGAKLSAIIVEYNQNIESSSVDKSDFEIKNYVKLQEEKNGFDKTIEIDGDEVKGNEGEITKIYVNDKPEISQTNGTKKGKYIIIEVNTSYMLSGSNLAYTASMMAGVKQIGEIIGDKGKILPSNVEISNYVTKEVEKTYNGNTKISTEITTEKDKIILPEFQKGTGWTLNYIGDGAFKATNAYSEYTGKYENFEIPYSIYVPTEEVLEKNKGNISLVIHMEHAGANDTDPMAAITSSKAATKLANKKVQEKNPAIILVPQIEESRRSTNDTNSSSEANTAIWELIDYILEKYKGYINESRIYGTGQSMGGMTILNMASQRDNFFGGISVIGAQWGNNNNKEFQNNGAAIRSPKNDKISFNGLGLDEKNYKNWYYMVSDDNILIHTAMGDKMAMGEWQYLVDYFAMAGVNVPKKEWDPYLPVEEQNEIVKQLVSHDNTKKGTGITWGIFTRGTHMSTWKYGYQLDYTFDWLFKQRRESQNKRGKIDQLKNEWLGRDKNGNIKKYSGTNNLNSQQFTISGQSDIFVEGWTPVSVVNKLIENLSQSTPEKSKENIETIKKYYNLLTEEEKKKIINYDKIIK